MFAEKGSFPVSIASAEQSESEHSTSTRVGDCVDSVKLNRNHFCVKAFVGVIYDAPTLDNIDGLISQETLCRPTWIVRVRAVIAVENSNNVCIRFEAKEIVEIVGLGLGAGNLDNPEILVLLR